MRRTNNWNVDLGQSNRVWVTDLKDALGLETYADMVLPLLKERYGSLIAINEMRRREAELLKTEATA